MSTYDSLGAQIEPIERKVVAYDYQGQEIYAEDTVIEMPDGIYVFLGDLKEYLNELDYKELLELVEAKEVTV